jgi:replication-associated recombination protein RarA
MSYKLPPTKNGLDPFHVLSAMQKCIRRGMEREAFEFACELIHTSKNYRSMVANRLEIISHEDICCMTQPHIVPFVRAAAQQSKELWDDNKPGKGRLPLGNAIRLMCRARKSREGDHFNGAIGIPSEIGEFIPEVPDWVLDHHTSTGKAKGRGMKYFRKHSTKLVPPAEPDEYEDEFYEMQDLKAGKGKRSTPPANARPSLTERRKARTKK